MCTGSWWDQLGCRLTSADWAADVGLPLAATLIGLAVALILVRRQLRSDIALRRAERRTRATDPLADELIAAGRNLSIFTIGAEDPFWSSPKWRDGHVVIGAYNSARDLMRPDGDLSDVLQAALRAHRAWELSRNFANETDLPAASVRICQVKLLGDYARELGDMGTALRRWDGLLPVPFSTGEERDRAAEARTLQASYRRVLEEYAQKPQGTSGP